MDVSDQKIKNKYCFAVIDDCSRNCLGLYGLNRISTHSITNLLDSLIIKNTQPREVLTDNGSVFGLRSKHSKFDRWCRREKLSILELQFIPQQLLVKLRDSLEHYLMNCIIVIRI